MDAARLQPADIERLREIRAFAPEAVREALQILEAQKLVVIFPNKATFVSEIETADLEKWYLPLAHLHALAAELACRSITDEQVAELRAIDEQIMVYIRQGDISNTLREDLLLHNRIISIADNEFIAEFSETLMLYIQRVEYAFFKKSGLTVESFTSHKALLDALARKDAVCAYDEMLHNWLTILDHSSELIGIELT